MTQEMKTKREELKGISNPLKVLIKNGVYASVNDALVDIYRKQGHTELHSYKQWKERGFQVKRGSKALLLWGEPRNGGKQEKPEKKDEGNEDEYKFFPLAYVFSQLQVEPLTKTNMQAEVYTLKKFYADTPAGTQGTLIKKWIDNKGYEWVKLDFGTNQTGQKLQKTFPATFLTK